MYDQFVPTSLRSSLSGGPRGLRRLVAGVLGLLLQVERHGGDVSGGECQIQMYARIHCIQPCMQPRLTYTYHTSAYVCHIRMPSLG